MRFNLKMWLIVFGMICTANAGQLFSDEGANEKKAPLEEAILAGGCFWCVESGFEKLSGVREVISGYTGGTKVNPTYKEVSKGKTSHYETVRVFFDPSEVSYEEILDSFWRQVNPTDNGGQFVDRGPQYRTAIFYLSEQQKKIAEGSKQLLDRSGRFDKPIVTPILKASEFYEAEDYHQDYYKKSPVRYRAYRFASGRDQYLKKIWGTSHPYLDIGKKKFQKPSDRELRKMLTKLQYRVTQKDGTERAYKNEYWNHKEEGIYVDVVSGEPLFNSLNKYDSKTGWPSFDRPLVPENMVEKEDRRFGMVRTEVRSKNADSHIGHIFNDGPPSTGLRYCINSAALRFVPVKDLEKEGYAEYLPLFLENLSKIQTD